MDTFKAEITQAIQAYEKYVVCLDKPPQDFLASVVSLVNSAMKAYETRGPGLRHGIALDRQITVIVSQSDADRPLCGIYFNLHSPYRGQLAAKETGKPRQEAPGQEHPG